VSNYNQGCESLDRAVADLASNKRLRSALEDVWTHLARVRRIAYRNPARLAETIDEHARIVRAIGSGQEDEAAAAVANHIRRSLQNVIESLAQGSSLNPSVTR
jgi:DNA-binding GntR family transcriptional regulator